MPSAFLPHFILMFYNLVMPLALFTDIFWPFDSHLNMICNPIAALLLLIVYITRHLAYITCHTTNIARHSSYMIRYLANIVWHPSNIACHFANIICHSLNIARHFTNMTRHYANITRRRLAIPDFPGAQGLQVQHFQSVFGFRALFPAFFQEQGFFRVIHQVV